MKNRKNETLSAIASAFYMMALVALLATVSAGCGGGGGGGGSIITPTDTPGTTTGTTVTVDSGLTALNNADYQTAKTQLNQVVSNPASTSADRAVAYSGIGWANIKSSSDSLDVDNAITSFTQAIDAANAAGSSAAVDQARQQAYIGLAAAQVIKNTGTSINDALTGLNSAGFSDLNQTYSEGKIVAGITNAEIRGYKTFLHYVRNQSGDATAANDNYQKLQSLLSSGTDKNAQMISDTLKSMGF